MKLSKTQKYQSLVFMITNVAYNLLRSDITILGHNVSQAAFKTCAPFIITKIDETTANNAEDLDLVMLLYNLTEYSSYYSDTTGSLWFYS